MTTGSIARVEPAAPADTHTLGRSSALVAAGILVSRVLGLFRQSAIVHYLGVESVAAEAFTAAFRVPNLLQNMLGEGALSASLIPVYARLRAENRHDEARHLAGAAGSLLALIIALLVLVGVVASPLLVALFVPGFRDERRELTIVLVRILFPGAGLFVASAWCLGILNSHRRFFLSYAAPAVWNIAIITALLTLGRGHSDARIATVLAWGSVAGALLQVLIQLPIVFRVAGAVRPSLDAGNAHVRAVAKRFGPALVTRGVVQISAYIDQVLASLLPFGAVAALGSAQLLYTLPVSLFGMSVSAAELPAMSAVAGEDDAGRAALRARIVAAARRVAFFIVPCVAAFVALGDVIAAAVFQSGRFTPENARWVWAILAGSATGLLAGTLGRVYSSAFYALKDTRSPLRFAVIRVVLTFVLGYLFAFPLPRALGIDPKWAVAGLTASAGIAGWVEFMLLRRTLARRIGESCLPPGYLAKLWGTAILATAAALAVHRGVHAGPRVTALLVCSVFGGVYLLVATKLGISEYRSLGRLFRR
ncbi:MAG: murein biosynthesis integral membrane protein MurJ [Gemmatimonadaceae bacterium]